MKDRINYTKVGEKLFNLENREIDDNSLPSNFSPSIIQGRDYTKEHQALLMGLQKKLSTLFEKNTINEKCRKSDKQNLVTLKNELLADLPSVGLYSEARAQKMAKNLYSSIGKGANLLMEVRKGRNYLLRINELQEKEEVNFQKRKEKITKTITSMNRESMINE